MIGQSINLFLQFATLMSIDCDPIEDYSTPFLACKPSPHPLHILSGHSLLGSQFLEWVCGQDVLIMGSGDDSFTGVFVKVR